MTHQSLGQELELFMFHELSPGSCFFLPKGTYVLNQMTKYLREKYRELDYQEVDTPNIFHYHLWEQSGHWKHYQDNMFSFQIKDTEESTYSLKPMNCPSHCLIYQSKVRSYRDLPLRYADFGVLHRNELSGSLSGLTRVRKFRQDDAHIFCTHDQVKQEVKQTLELLSQTYKLFNFSYRVTVSTRPDKFLGDEDMWRQAEKNLIDVIEELKIDYKINDKDGAFYGPKIDILIKDFNEREYQCGTIQLDYQLPISFDLKYSNHDDQLLQPVIIHRAIYGSFERFLAILLEHFQGHLPLWLSPRQILIVPVGHHEEICKYGEKLKKLFFDHNFEVMLDDSSNKLNYKIRNGEIYKFNHILVIGNKELENNTVNLRAGKKMLEMKVDDFLAMITKQRDDRSII